MAMGSYEYCYLLWIKERFQVSFSKSAMLGRQWFFGVEKRIANLMGTDSLTQDDGYCERMFEALGAEEIRSYDISDYEKATDLVDFSNPISEEHKNRFSFVLDGGLLEHVFDYTTSIRNAMSMPEIGGTLVLMTPTNGWNGHGFYQFSAELFYRLFCEENGYELLDVSYRLSGEDSIAGLGTRFYHIPDPEKSGCKTGLDSQFSGLLYVTARRIGAIPEKFHVYESDYSKAWDNEIAISNLKYKQVANPLLNKYFDLPMEVENYLRPIQGNWLRHFLSVYNRKIKVIFYGRGYSYQKEREKFIHNENIEIELIVDIKAGELKILDEDGYTIFHPSAIKEKPFDIIVVTSGPHYHEIENMLIYAYGLNFKRIMSLDEFLYYLLR